MNIHLFFLTIIKSVSNNWYFITKYVTQLFRQTFPLSFSIAVFIFNYIAKLWKWYFLHKKSSWNTILSLRMQHQAIHTRLFYENTLSMDYFKLNFSYVYNFKINLDFKKIKKIKNFLQIQLCNTWWKLKCICRFLGVRFIF